MNTKKINYTGLTAALITLLGWSLAGVFIKLLPELGMLTIVAIRLSISLIVIFPILFFMKKINYLKELKMIITWRLGTILFFCYLLGTLAFQMAPIGEVATLMALSPLFVILLKFMINGTFRKKEFLGISIAFTGVFLIIFNSLSFEQVNNLDNLIGNFCALLSSILFAFYGIWYKVLNTKSQAPNAISVAISVFILGVFLLIALLYRGITINFIPFDSFSILYLLGISILSTAIPTISYTITSKYLSPIFTTSVLLLQPIVAIILALLIIKEVPNIFVIPGFVLIMAGLTIIIKLK